MKVIVAGSRSITDYNVVCTAIERSGFAVTEVVSGTASGVDRLGERWGAEHGVPVTRMPAQWEAHGRAAGPMRNRAMADYGNALVAVWDGASRGMLNMIRTALDKRLQVYVYVHLTWKP